MSTAINSNRSWDADLVALRDEIFAEGRCTIREAAEMARNSIGMMANYCAEWDLNAHAAAAAVEASRPAPQVEAAPSIPAGRKSAYYASQGATPVRNDQGYLMPSATARLSTI